jgi:hypothetical protein
MAGDPRLKGRSISTALADSGVGVLLTYRTGENEAGVEEITRWAAGPDKTSNQKRLSATTDSARRPARRHTHRIARFCAGAAEGGREQPYWEFSRCRP